MAVKVTLTSGDEETIERGIDMLSRDGFFYILDDTDARIAAYPAENVKRAQATCAPHIVHDATAEEIVAALACPRLLQPCPDCPSLRTIT